jgi:hypothetical protein
MANRVFRRDAKGRFASTGSANAPSPDAARRKRRRRAGLAGTAVAATAVAASQVHPASRTRTAITRRKLVAGHVARVASDHRRMVTLTARALPHRVTTGARLPALARKAARAEGRTLTRGYRRQVKRVRKTRRR